VRGRDGLAHAFITPRILARASVASSMASARMSSGDAGQLEVELEAGDALGVPQSLKSMSPKWSSDPRMSVSVV
jgi:hypothetical protein